MQKNKMLVVLILPILAILIFLIIPFLSFITPTFFNNNVLTISKYIEFLSNQNNVVIILRTLKIALIVTVICTFLGIPTSYCIANTNEKYKNYLLTIVVFPLLVNAVVRSLSWMTILGKNGFINKILSYFNLIDSPVRLLYTEFSVIIGLTYIFLPLMIVSLVGVMDNISKDLELVAESLGASRRTTFFKIVLPLSIPGIIIGSVLVFTGAMTSYTTPQLLGGNETIVLSTLIYQQGMVLGNWDIAALIATLMMVITMFVLATFNHIVKKLGYGV